MVKVNGRIGLRIMKWLENEAQVMLTWISMQSSAFAQDGGAPSAQETQGGKFKQSSAEQASQVVDSQRDALETRLLGELPSDTVINAPYESNELAGIVWVYQFCVYDRDHCLV